MNIALVLAEAGKKVCLVEGDLRKPRVSKYLGLIGSVGLSSVLAGQADLDDVLQVTSNADLTVLASGPIPPNPSELLGTDTAHAVFTDLRRRFDYVIIDASPLLPVTDAAVLSALADGALVIARHGTTKREQLSRGGRQSPQCGRDDSRYCHHDDPAERSWCLRVQVLLRFRSGCR